MVVGRRLQEEKMDMGKGKRAKKARLGPDREGGREGEREMFICTPQQRTEVKEKIWRKETQRGAQGKTSNGRNVVVEI